MKTIQVRLLQAHKHDGREYPAGSIIEVPEDLEAFLTAKPKTDKDRPQLAELVTE